MTRPPTRRPSRDTETDAGFTLIELIFAIVLSSLIVGVVAAAMVTSLTVARSTTDQVGDSTDAGLISSFLIRDAQSAGATDPVTALRDTTLGALGITTNSADVAFTGCVQPAAFVVRFSWIDPVDRTKPVVVYYSLDATKAVLTRRMCKGGSTADVVVGRRLTQAVASCDTACSGAPTTVSLALKGSGARAPFAYTLRVSLRVDTQTVPTVANSAAVPVLALGGSACPNLGLGGTGIVTVNGEVRVGSSCSGTKAVVEGDQGLLRPSREAVQPMVLKDPYEATPPADGGLCAAGGANPPLGSSGDPDAVVVYPQLVTIAGGNVAFGVARELGGLCRTVAEASFHVTGEIDEFDLDDLVQRYRRWREAQEFSDRR